MRDRRAHWLAIQFPLYFYEATTGNEIEMRSFTSESVSEGHPDKIADRISDAILDKLLVEDPNARVACETLVKSNMVVVAGEVGSELRRNIVDDIGIIGIVRRVAHDVGYDDPALGFDIDSCNFICALGKQSENIAQSVNHGQQKDKKRKQGAGDQGLMFGYATNETKALMPAPIYYAHQLMRRHAELRRSRKLSWLCPDAKSQVTFCYDGNGKPSSVHTVVISTQHRRMVDRRGLKKTVIKEAVTEEIIKPVLGRLLTKKTDILVNPAGDFVTGGPLGDCGLTGRKIIVDTYGGMARHGGGAFSGKDPSKVDRSAAYAARYVAKHIVAAGLADKCELQVSYAIGEAKPVAIDLNTFDTSKTTLKNRDIEVLIQKHFDLSPSGIIEMLDLKHPIYEVTATYGHFGREAKGKEFTWEKLDEDKINALKAVL